MDVTSNSVFTAGGGDASGYVFVILSIFFVACGCYVAVDIFFP